MYSCNTKDTKHGVAVGLQLHHYITDSYISFSINNY